MFNHDDPTECVKVKNEAVQNLYFDGGIILEYEIQQLCKIFPNVQKIKIEGENILEYKFDLKPLKDLERIVLEIDPSNEYTGYIDEEETDPKLKFGIDLEPCQVL